MSALFPRVFIAGAREDGPGRDATRLAAALADGAEAVTLAWHADLIVTGSAAAGAPGLGALAASDRALLEGARCPVAVAPRGLAERADYALRRIDVGFDGGRDAAVALDLAERLARGHGARLRVIGVAEVDGDGRGADPREVERLARRLAGAAQGAAGLAVETELREGLPEQVLLDLAGACDLLVLGSRTAYGDVGAVAIGDVATRILSATPSPTLIVPAA